MTGALSVCLVYPFVIRSHQSFSSYSSDILAWIWMKLRTDVACREIIHARQILQDLWLLTLTILYISAFLLNSTYINAWIIKWNLAGLLQNK